MRIECTNGDIILKLNFRTFSIFLNTGFSFIICNIHIQLWEHLNNVADERSVSQFFLFRPWFIFYEMKHKK